MLLDRLRIPFRDWYYPNRFLLHTIVIAISVAFDLNGSENSIYLCASSFLAITLCVCVLCLLARFDLQCAHTAEWLTPFRFNTASGQ